MYYILKFATFDVVHHAWIAESKDFVGGENGDF
jgi:hypothetical protein